MGGYQDSARLLRRTNLRGRSGKKIAQIEKLLRIEWSGLWMHRKSWLKVQMRPILQPNTNAEKNVPAVMSIALSSLIGSPGTLGHGGDGRWKAKKERKLHAKSITSSRADFAVIGVQLCSTITGIFVLEHHRWFFDFNWIVQGLFFRFVFIFNFLNFNYFSFFHVLVLVIHHFW